MLVLQLFGTNPRSELWGKPGGRPVRSKLDSAIKEEQIKIGIEGLKPDAHHLVEHSGKSLKKALVEIWSRPEEEKKAWLLAVLVARDGAKQYIDDGNESTI